MKKKIKKSNCEKIEKKMDKEFAKLKLQKVMNFDHDLYYHLVMAAKDFAIDLDDPSIFDDALASFCGSIAWRIEDYERKDDRQPFAL